MTARLLKHVSPLILPAAQVNGDFGSIFSTLLPGTTAKLEPQEGCSFMEGEARGMGGWAGVGCCLRCGSMEVLPSQVGGAADGFPFAPQPYICPSSFLLAYCCRRTLNGARLLLPAPPRPQAGR